MKTYRLYALKVITDTEAEKKIYNIDIEDGLIIDMEDHKKKWLIDVIITDKDRSLIEKVAGQSSKLKVEVIITSKNNRPAMMDVTLRKVIELTSKIGILFEGYLVQTINKS